MSRIAKANVHAALERVAQHINDAGGADGRISRSDMQQKLETLQGTERDLADMFFRFIDHRDYQPGASVTANDVNKAVEYAKERMIDKYDLNNNGLSKSEINNMSRTGQLAVQLSREISAASEDILAGDAFAQALELKADGLTYMSESDEPYVAFSHSFDADTVLTPDTFREALNVPADTDVYNGDIDLFFQEFAISEDNGGRAWNDAEAAQYKALDESLSGLSHLQMIHVGNDSDVEGDVYFVGKDTNGDLVGLQTSRIWT